MLTNKNKYVLIVEELWITQIMASKYYQYYIFYERSEDL